MDAKIFKSVVKSAVLASTLTFVAADLTPGSWQQAQAGEMDMKKMTTECKNKSTKEETKKCMSMIKGKEGKCGSSKCGAKSAMKGAKKGKSGSCGAGKCG